MLLDVAMKAFSINDIDKHEFAFKTFTLCVAICKMHFVITNKMCKKCVKIIVYAWMNIFITFVIFLIMRFNIIFFLVHLSKSPTTPCFDY
jgi:hypothetical protein